MKQSLLSRRDMISRSLRSAAGLGLSALAAGSLAQPAFGQETEAEEKPSINDLNYLGNEVCVLTCTQTLGPCYSANPPVRQDITSGKIGMPVKLGFRVVDTTCTPVPNATVDIWHTDVAGAYSALAGFCANGDPNAPGQNFLRGVQPVDADGWAYFDSIYPGWYPGRTTHIHATIRVGGQARVTTQFYFWDKVSEYIYRNHPLYRHRPARNTTNRTDNILGGSMIRMTPYVLGTKATTLKQMTAFKTVVLQGTPTTCAA
jgi:protocatechuate 3,4-dioxygenase beta subunit